jgi:hypothetical protein
MLPGYSFQEEIVGYNYSFLITKQLFRNSKTVNDLSVETSVISFEFLDFEILSLILVFDVI